MTNKSIYKLWAPAGAKWVDWVRPVPFVAIKNDTEIYDVGNFLIPNINYIKELQQDTAVIVDLDGIESVKEGLGLAKLGFRPIPIYNGTNEQSGVMATVNNHAIEIGLIKGAKILKKLNLSLDAPPVFLLDSNRLHRYKMNISVFDNSWDIYDQDMPTAEYFLNNGISKIIVRGKKINKDLKLILYKFQKQKIEIFFTNGYEEPKKVHIKNSLANIMNKDF